jgi:hypothetical protein
MRNLPFFTQRTYTRLKVSHKLPSITWSQVVKQEHDIKRYVTTCTGVGLLNAVQKSRCAAQSSDKKTGESYYPASALSSKITVTCYVLCKVDWKDIVHLSFP